MSDLIDKRLEESREQRAERKRKRELSDIRFVVNTVEGRRFYWRIMEEGRIFVSPFCGENTNETNRRIGGADVSRTFMDDLLEAKTEAFTQMQQERMAEAKIEEIADNKLKKKPSDPV